VVSQHGCGVGGHAAQTDYGALSTRSVWRTNRHHAAEKVESLSSNGKDAIESPTLLRKQADRAQRAAARALIRC